MALTIKNGSNTSWKYAVRYPDPTFILDNKIYVQIETNGAIYLLLPKTKQAVKQFPPQPDGFPLRPKDKLN